MKWTVPVIVSSAIKKNIIDNRHIVHVNFKSAAIMDTNIAVSFLWGERPPFQSIKS